MCIAIGYDKKYRPTELLYLLTFNDKVPIIKGAKSYWDSRRYVELICKAYNQDIENPLDLIFMYDNPQDRSSGALYLGRWNDGYITQ